MTRWPGRAADTPPAVRDASASETPRDGLRRSLKQNSYLLVFLAIAIATLVRSMFEQQLNHLPFLLYVPVLLMAGWLGGARLGLLTTLVTLFVGWLFFIQPQSAGHDSFISDPLRVIVFACAGVCISVLGELVFRSRRQASLTEARYQFLAEATRQFVWTRDNLGRVNYVNNHWLSYTGMTLGEARDGSWLELVHPEDRPKFAAAYQSATRDTDYELEVRFRRAFDGAFRWHLVRGWQVPAGTGDTRWMGTAVDIDDRKLAEEALRISEERFRSIVEAAAEGIWIINTESITTFVNDQMVRLLGYEPSEMLGRSCFDFIHPEEKERGLDGFRKRKAEKDNEAREYRFIRKDGAIRWLSFVGSPMHDISRQIIGIIAMCTDTTERHEAEARIRELNKELTAKLTELETLLTVVPVGIGFSYDVYSRTAILNDAAKKILGLEHPAPVHPVAMESRALPYRVLRNGADVQPEDLPMQLAVRTRQPVLDAEYDIVRQDGRLIQIICWASPLLDEKGEPRGSVAAFMDMSQRKKTEMALRRANSALEQFAYAAAHDLQEPARTVTLYTQLLARDYGAKLDSRAQGLITGMIEGSRRMENLIRDLLAYTRATDEDSVDAVADVQQALNEVSCNLAVAIEAAGAEISRNGLPREVGIRHVQLVQILQNLLSNALKYRGASPPRIHISAQAHAAGWEFSIRDNGPGIPKQYQQQIFRVFNRLHGRDIPGTGIGLAICQRIVAHYGGRIWVESETGVGADFRFTLPEARAAA